MLLHAQLRQLFCILKSDYLNDQIYNSYLAESVGYNNGRANGMIAERDQEIDRLSNEIHKGNAFIKELRAALEKSQRVSDLYHSERDQLCIETAQLRKNLQLLQEQIQAMRD